MVSIGGNDVGFSRLLANAVLSDESLLRQLGGWFGEVQGFLDANARLDRLEDLYKTLNRALHNILHIPWARIGPHSRHVLSAAGAAGGRQARSARTDMPA